MISLKQFGVLVTALRRNVFDWARFRLTVFYALTFVVALLMVDSLINYTRTKVVEQNIQEQIANPQINQVVRVAIQTTINRLQALNYLFYLLLTVIVTSIGYFLAGRTLRPINAMVQSQRRFLANAAHELRTPLSVIKTECEVAMQRKDSLSAKELVTVMKSNIEEINRMSEIINNLLLISHSSSDKNRIPFMVVNLADAVRRAKNNMAEFALKHGVNLTAEIPAEIEVRGNLVALEEIITNLIRNAITHSPQDGSVAVTLRQERRQGLIPERRQAIILVSDTGLGIAPTELPHVFEPFFRANTEPKKQSSGSGLGLTITKELVEIHGGAIDISSLLGKGTTVRVSFPLA